MSTASDFDIAARFSYLCIQAEEAYLFLYYFCYITAIYIIFSWYVSGFFSKSIKHLNINICMLKYNIQFSSLLNILIQKLLYVLNYLYILTFLSKDSVKYKHSVKMNISINWYFCASINPVFPSCIHRYSEKES